MKYFNIIFLFFRIKIIYNFSYNELFNNVNLYSNELCAYNGIPRINSTTNEIICECKEKYTNEPRKDKIKYINGHMIQCSYKRKSRFFALFLASCIPFGFDFLYLKRYIIFSVSFTMTIITLSLNILLFIINYNMNLKTKETKIQIRLNKMIKKVKDNKIENDESNKNIKILIFICKFLSINHIFYIIIVVIFHLCGKITDGNHVYTENDLRYFFTSPD